MVVGIPFSNIVGKQKTKTEVEIRIPFSKVVKKRKTEMDTGIPFSKVVKKRKTEIEL